MKFNTYKLYFKTPLHIGNQRADESISLKNIQSDSFWAALTACLAKTRDVLPENGDFCCVISSLFPFYQRKSKDELVYFLPMPLQSRLPELKDVAQAKKVKKVQWVDSRLYGNLLQGLRFFDGEQNSLNRIQGVYLTDTLLPKDINGSQDFVESEVKQRAAIKDRTGESDAEPFYVEQITFRYDSGLYFLVPEDADTTLLDKALNILKEEGIGTGRHIGFGIFDVEKGDLELSLPAENDANHMVSLSFFIPESKEQLSQLLASDNVAYDFTRRGGWITAEKYNSFRKNVIYGFMPGSVFRKVDKGQSIAAIGRIVDLRPDIMADGHPVWRNGKAIMLPIKIV